jgi:DNA-directed RNA polymerase subunit RPC12/RpoP
MGWRFRQSFKILPGLKLNLSKTGLSASIGGAPFTINVGTRGLMATASIPGTGISFRQRISGSSHSNPEPNYEPSPPVTPGELPSFPSNPPPSFDRSYPPTREIHSASTELLTSESLKEIKRLIQTAYEEHEEINAEFTRAKQENDRATSRFNSWSNGFLLKKLFKKSFEVRKVEAEIATAKALELEEQLRLTTISTQIDLANEQAEPFFRLRDDFTALSDCAAIWDVKAERATDQFHERTIANRSVSRDRIKFALGSCDLIQWEQEVPHLQNANGGDIFLYPGFILYRASKTAFSVIDFHDVKLVTAAVKFHEQDGVPSDSKVVGQTWAKTNKDGSRDKRFAGNYQIPIALYGDLTLKSETGLWEEFQFSNPEQLERFVKSWNTFVASFDHRISLRFDQEVVTPPVAVQSPINSPSLVGAEIHFECNACRQPIEVNVEAVGQEFRCPGCGEKLVVPEVSI